MFTAFNITGKYAGYIPDENYEARNTSEASINFKIKRKLGQREVI